VTLSLSSAGGGGDGDGSDLATRVQQLEDYWQTLNSLPTNSEMFRRLHKFKQIEEGQLHSDSEIAEALVASSATGGSAGGTMPLCHPRQPMLELWHAMQLLNQVENNTAGITRVRIRHSRAVKSISHRMSPLFQRHE